MKVVMGFRGDRKQCVKCGWGNWICEGMFVIEKGETVESSYATSKRKGFVKAVLDENGIGKGKIQVKVIVENGELLNEKEYITEFEPAENWCVPAEDC